MSCQASSWRCEGNMWQELKIFLSGQGRLPVTWRLPARHRAPKGFDVANIREFLPGDSPRQIDRKRFLSRGDQLVIEKHPDSNALLLILLDVSASEYTGAVRSKIEAGLDLVRYLGTACLTKGHLLQVVAFTDMVELETAVIRNNHALEEALEELRSFSPLHRATDCLEALEYSFYSAMKQDHPADMVCLVSDFYFSTTHQQLCLQLADLKELTDIVAICLHDPIEVFNPPILGPLLGRDVESGAMTWGVPPKEIDLLPEFERFGIDYCLLETGQSEESWYYILDVFFSGREQ